MLTIFLVSSALMSVTPTSRNTSRIGKTRVNGTLTFRARTVDTNQQYSPSNIGAIWVTTSSGTFVKTLKRWGTHYLQYLTRWQSASNGNTVDAITGATLNQHALHNVTWDCTDVSGSVVADGDYKVWIEFTERNGSGPYYSVSFTKGSSPVTLNPAAQTYFTNLYLQFVPETTYTIEMQSFTVSLSESISVMLNWTTSAEAGLSGYRVYRGTTNVLNDASTIGEIIAASNASGGDSYQTEDTTVSPGATYYYWLCAIAQDTTTQYFGPQEISISTIGNEDDVSTVTPATTLHGNYPNPFNPSTELSFSVKPGERADLTIFDILGNPVRHFGSYGKGDHRVVWNGTNDLNRAVASGVYLAVLKSPNGSSLKRLTLMK
jgi:flagellar hook assembly protein FlgD